MKKFLLLLISLIFLCGVAGALVACSGGTPSTGDGNIVNNGEYLAYTGDINYRFAITSEEECPAGNINEAKLHSTLDLEQGKTYYVVLDCMVNNFDWAEDNFTISTFICNNNGLTATLHEVATGDFKEKTEDYKYVISTRFSTPQNRTEAKSYRVVYEVKMTEGLLLTANMGIDGLDLSAPFAVGDDFVLSPDEEKSSYMIKGFSGKEVENLAIPAYYGETPVTGIATEVFKECSYLKKISIPSTIAAIGANAFSGCADMSVYIDNIAAWCAVDLETPESSPLNARDFYVDNQLAVDLVIPNGVTEIKKNAFYGTRITGVELPASVNKIDENAFANCNMLKDLYMDDIAAWCNIDFAGENSNPQFFAENTYVNGKQITNLAIPDGVQEIKNYAFEYFKGPSVAVPSSVSKIGKNAFYHCCGLTEAAFAEDGNLDYIGERAFSGCASLKSVQIPQRVTAIDTEAFYGCDLSGFIISNGSKLSSIGQGAFGNSSGLERLILPGSLITIESGAFENSAKLASVTVAAQSNLQSLGENAFANCAKLAYFTFGKDSIITAIGNGAFNGDKLLKNLVIPDSVISIGSEALKDCKLLEKLSIPNGVTLLGTDALKGCSALTEISIPYIGDGTDQSAYFGRIFGAGSYINNAQYVPPLLKSVIITGGNGIGNYAFYGCKYLTKISLPINLNFIGQHAFDQCAAELNLGEINSLLKIDSLAFYGYNGRNLTIPRTVTSIGEHAFNYCTSEITWQSNPTIKKLGDYSFGGYRGQRITIPGSVTAIGKYAFTESDAQIVWDSNTSITDIGDYAFGGYKGQNLTLPQSITSIGSYTFEYCKNISQIEIPQGVTSIGNYAFEYCTSLTNITLPENVTYIGDGVFNGCISLGSIIMGNGVTSIGNYAFFGCKNITNIVLPDSVTYIGQYSFTACRSLESITLPFIGDGSDKQAYLGWIFGACNYKENEQYVPSSLKTVIISDENLSMSSYAFYGCRYLENVTIPDRASSIDMYAFYGCASLKNIIIPEGVTSIGAYAFSGCGGLEGVYITDLKAWCNIEFSVGSNPLIYADNLYLNNNLVTDLAIPQGVKEIKHNAFECCAGLKNISIPDSVEIIGEQAFRGCESLKNINIPDSVTSIKSLAFIECTSLENFDVDINNANYSSQAGILYNKNKTEILIVPLTKKEVIIPHSVTIIGNYAFAYCANLGSIIIPDSVTAIGDSAFYGCTNLVSITIPARVTSIGCYILYGCTKLKEVTFKNTTGWTVSTHMDMSDAEDINVDDPTQNANVFLIQTYSYYWKRYDNKA